MSTVVPSTGQIYLPALLHSQKYFELQVTRLVYLPGQPRQGRGWPRPGAVILQKSWTWQSNTITTSSSSNHKICFSIYNIYIVISLIPSPVLTENPALWRRSIAFTECGEFPFQEVISFWGYRDSFAKLGSLTRTSLGPPTLGLRILIGNAQKQLLVHKCDKVDKKTLEFNVL